MANEAEQAIAERLANAPTFHPVTADLFVDDWGLDAGDVVTVRSGETDYSVPIYNMSFDWRGSAMAQIQSTGNKERKPLPALKRKEFRSGRSGYATQKQADGYYEDLIRDHGQIGLVAGALGVVLDSDGNPVVDPETGKLVYDEDSPAEMFSQLLVTPNYASLVSALNNGNETISGSKINLSNQGTVLIQAINNRPSSQSEVIIEADKIDLRGVVTTDYIDAEKGIIDDLISENGYAGTLSVTNLNGTYGNITQLTVGSFYFRDTPQSTTRVSRKGVKIGNSAVSDSLLLLGTGSDSNLQIPNAVTHFGAASPSGGTISIPYYTYDSGGGQAAGNITFNIADTAYYQSHIGISSTGSWEWDAEAGGGDGGYVRVIIPKAGSPETISFPGVSAQATIAYNSSTHKYTALAVAKYGGRDVSALDSELSGLEGYNDGYDTASGQVVLPGAGTSASLIVTYPKTTTSGGTTTRMQSATTYALEASNLTVSVTTGSGNNKVTHATKTCSDTNLVASNIKNGVSIFGVTGSYSGGTPGIFTVDLNGPATGPYTDGTDKGTLTANRYYQVKATPNSGSPVYIKFKTPASSSGGSSANIDLQVQTPRRSVPSGSGYTTVVAMPTLAQYIRQTAGSSVAYYIPIEATAPGCTGTKLYYVQVGGS